MYFHTNLIYVISEKHFEIYNNVIQNNYVITKTREI